VPALIGMLMLISIVVTNAIVLIDLVNQYWSAGAGVRDAGIDGVRRPLRPILMTAAGGPSVTGLVTTGKRTPPLGAVLTLVDVEGKQVGQTTSAADGSYLPICGLPAVAANRRRPGSPWTESARSMHRAG